MMPLFWFSVRQALFDRKMWLAALFAAVPCALAVLFRYHRPSGGGIQSPWEAYHFVVQYLMFGGVVPLLCMLYGPALIAAEAESGTLVYLVSRQMRRGTVLLVRYAATLLALSVVLGLTLLAHFLCTIVGVDSGSTGAARAAGVTWQDLACYLLITPAAVAAYVALFATVSLITARSLVLSGLYLFSVEMVIANLPLSIRVFSITHLLRKTLTSWLPDLRELYSLPGALTKLIYPAGESGMVTLVLVVAFTLIIAWTLVTFRELTPAKAARE